MNTIEQLRRLVQIKQAHDDAAAANPDRNPLIWDEVGKLACDFSEAVKSTDFRSILAEFEKMRAVCEAANNLVDGDVCGPEWDALIDALAQLKEGHP
jgi:hypothetical protein